jgi:hypothetical protein
MEQRLIGLMVPDRETIMKRIRQAMAARQALGREKYPTTLEHNPAPIEERVRHLWEELLDGLAYAQWILDRWVELQRQHGPHEVVSAGAVAVKCERLIGEALVELDRLMRSRCMDPVRKERQP